MNEKIVNHIAKNIEKYYDVTNLLDKIDNKEILVNYTGKEIAVMLGNIAGLSSGNYTYYNYGKEIFLNISHNRVFHFEILGKKTFRFVTECFINPHTNFQGINVSANVTQNVEFIITSNKDYHTGYPRIISKRDYKCISKNYKSKIANKYKYFSEYINASKDLDQAFYLYEMETFGEDDAMDFKAFNYVYNLITGEFKNEM